MEDILSQDEVDALLRGMGGGDIDTEDDDSSEATSAKVYDFTNQERIVRGRLPALDIINERFARGFQRHFNEMIMSSVEVTAGEVKIIKMIDYLRNLFVPTSLNIYRINPLNGVSLFTLDSKLIFTAVDIYFGGTGLLPFKIEGREYTPVEMSMVRSILDISSDNLRKAWGPVMDIEIDYMHSEMNPKFASIVEATDMIVVSPINVRFEGVEGRVDIVMPYAMLEPVRDKLEEGMSNLQGESDNRWSRTLKEEAKNIEVEVSVNLAELKMNMDDLMKMEKGDIIPIEMPDRVAVKAEGIAFVKGKLGESNDKKAVKVEEILHHPAYSERMIENVKEWYDE
ncbi:flagellar motor switch protein FliM [Hydrogenovibrio marinus]|uniref:Flagellar motor switch protein FliM n=1 Tax=Hydrogenovibrio marinus TaxID=28885 RepID=A0A066ZSY3_HYDMR|nr:flagellar motor switch protein FliM [Hydrogenovibrio marinus]KDN95394.1 flagellar motor switch protein FliM [Hydrogenovibrio marinus]BBN59883.1 flagellar motor switch protein FliM [Hydrogenovibrio marinus]